MAEGLFLVGAMALGAIAAFLILAWLAATSKLHRPPWRILWATLALAVATYLATFRWDGVHEVANAVRAGAMVLTAAALGGLLGCVAGVLVKRFVDRI